MKKRFLSLILSMVLCLGLFAPAMAAEKTFSDVPKTHWAYQAVGAMVDKGLFSGTTETTFSPGEHCTRGQIVTFLWRAFGSPEPKTAACPFTDVTEDSFCYKAVLWAVENGITTGTSETEFSPNAPCTRAQAVTFLYRALKAAASGSSTAGGGSEKSCRRAVRV